MKERIVEEKKEKGRERARVRRGNGQTSEGLRKKKGAGGKEIGKIKSVFRTICIVSTKKTWLIHRDFSGNFRKNSEVCWMEITISNIFYRDIERRLSAVRSIRTQVAFSSQIAFVFVTMQAIIARSKLRCKSLREPLTVA